MPQGNLSVHTCQPSSVRLSLRLKAIVCLLLVGFATQLWAKTPTSVNFGPVAVGSVAGKTLTLPIPIPASLVLGSYSVVTQGRVSQDFIATGGTCANGSTNGTCTVDVQFLPLYPGFRQGALQLYDQSNKLAFTLPLFGVGTAPMLGFIPGTISTYAGNGIYGFAGDGGPAINGEFYEINGLATDFAGNLYVADFGNNAIRKVAPDGTISTVGGGHWCGLSVDTGDGGLAVDAHICGPYAIAPDGAGNLYIADYGDSLIRKISADGRISTIAGVYNPNLYLRVGYNGDGKLATSALLGQPLGVAVDGRGNVYIADSDNNIVRKVDTNGMITTFAGTPPNNNPTPPTYGYAGDGGQAAQALLDYPTGVVVDPDGNVFIADDGNSVIRKVDTSGIITTYAGMGQNPGYSGDNGPATSAQLAGPINIAMDDAGDLYISDSGNSAVRMVTPGGMISTVAGVGPCPSPYSGCYTGDGGPATAAKINHPVGIAIDQLGNFYFADNWNDVIRKVDVITPPMLSFPDTVINTASAPQNLAILNLGNTPLTVSQISVDTNFSLGGPDTSCTFTNQILKPGNYCVLGAEFVPTVKGYLAGNILLNDDSLNNLADTKTVPLQGTGLLNPQNITYTMPSPVTYGDTPFPITATASSGLPVTLTYQYGPILWDGATATITGAGPVLIQASQAGNAAYAPASASISFTILQAQLSAVANNHTMAYGTTMPTLDGTLTGVVPGDGITASYSVSLSGTPGGPGRPSVKPTSAVAVPDASAGPAPTGPPSVGLHPIFVLLSDPNGKISNYSVFTQGATLTVTPDVPAAIQLPVPGDTLGSTNVAFSWDTGTGLSGGYQLLLGTTGIGSSDLYASGIINTSNVIVPSIPANALTVYVRLLSKLYSGWSYADYTYTEAGVPTPAVLQTPASALLGTGNVAFTWSSGVGVTAYQLLAGTTGAGSSDLYSSGAIAATNATVSGIPANALPVYVRLFSKISGAWSYIDYTFTESGTPTPAAILTPTVGTALGTANVPFTWTAGVGVTVYQLVLGTTGPGSSDLYSSGVLAATTATVGSIPANAVPVNVRLLSKVNGAWTYFDYLYTEAGTPTPAVMLSPSAGTKLGTADVTFNWTSGLGVNGGYQLLVGTNGVGSSNLYSSGVTMATSAVVASIPGNAVPVYVRLLSKINGIWSYSDYAYTEAGSVTAAAMQSPSPGGILGTTDVQFTWNLGIGNNGGYQLVVGTNGVGSNNLYNSGVTLSTTATVPTIPSGGAKVYVRLFSRSNGVWQYRDYTYTEQ